MNQKDLLKRLVENAMDFLSQSISEFDKHPKYSVIHFHAAIDLFLKARLLAEHWSLVVTKRKDADWNKFVAGDFISVSLDEATDKLDKVVRSGLDRHELEVFRKLTSHRNKMMHFFHEAMSAEKNKRLSEVIAKEQLTAWYLLHKILIGRWSDVFSPWSEKLKEIDEKLRKLQKFLQVIFDQLEPEITRRKGNGAIFRGCPSCNFPSQEHIGDTGELYKAKCLVCGFIDTCLTIECPDCEISVLFVNEGFGECSDCKRKFEPEHVAEELINHEAAYIAMKDGDDSWEFGNCSDCDGYHTVVRLDQYNCDYLCAVCFGVFDSMQNCGWCNDLNTGDMEYSYWAGCNFCDGQLKWDDD